MVPYFLVSTSNLNGLATCNVCVIANTLQLCLFLSSMPSLLCGDSKNSFTSAMACSSFATHVAIVEIEIDLGQLKMQLRLAFEEEAGPTEEAQKSLHKWLLLSYAVDHVVAAVVAHEQRILLSRK